MLHIRIERPEGPAVEVAEPHTGQRLSYRPSAVPGEPGLLEVHVWWGAAELRKNEPETFEALLQAFPLQDEIVVRRHGPDGTLRDVFRGPVAETGTDGQRLFLSAEAPCAPAGADHPAGA